LRLHSDRNRGPARRLAIFIDLTGTEETHMNLIFSIPAILLLACALVLSIGLVCFGQMLVHRRVRRDSLIEHNEVGGIIFVVTGTLYAVLLGFFTVIAWQHFQDAREIVIMESNADIDAWHSAVGLPPAVREVVRSDMLNYANVVTEREWPAMRRGKFDNDLAFIGMHAIDVASSFDPKTLAEANAQAETMKQLSIVHDGRQQRIGVNRDGINWFEWIVLLIGGICIICFSWFFGLKNERIHLAMTSAIVTVMVPTMVLLFELQYPFRSDVGIGPDSWQYAIAHIHQMQDGSLPNMRM
jgi:hypothetical protein